MTTIPKKAKVVIIGGGIHGLSTAWHLSQKYKNENDVVFEFRNERLLEGRELSNQNLKKKNLLKYILVRDL